MSERRVNWLQVVSWVPGGVSVAAEVTWRIDDMVRRPVGPMPRRI